MPHGSRGLCCAHIERLPEEPRGAGAKLTTHQKLWPQGCFRDATTASRFRGVEGARRHLQPVAGAAPDEGASALHPDTSQPHRPARHASRGLVHEVGAAERHFLAAGWGSAPRAGSHLESRRLRQGPGGSSRDPAEAPGHDEVAGRPMPRQQGRPAGRGRPPAHPPHCRTPVGRLRGATRLRSPPDLGPSSEELGRLTCSPEGPAGPGGSDRNLEGGGSEYGHCVKRRKLIYAIF